MPNQNFEFLLLRKKERSLYHSIFGLFFCCIICFLFLLVGRRFLDILDINPLVLRLAVSVLALFSLKAETEFGAWWYFFIISFPLFLIDHDTNERVRARAAWRGPDSGVHHAWRTTGTASGEVHLPPALEKPDEWTDTGRGHLVGHKHLSCPHIWQHK